MSIDFDNADFSDIDFGDNSTSKNSQLDFSDFDNIEFNFSSDSRWNDDTITYGIDYELDMQKRSEDDYIEITNKIVGASVHQLSEQNKSKSELKSTFTKFFILFVSAQYIALVLFLALRMIFGVSNLSDGVIIAYISSVFVETLGAIVLMIKYAFDSKQETNVLKILSAAISNYQKFGGTKNNKTKK